MRKYHFLLFSLLLTGIIQAPPASAAVDYFGSQIHDQQGIEVIPGVGHSGRLMFQSDCGLVLFYDYDPDATACAGSDVSGSEGGGNGGKGGKGGGKGKKK